MSKQFLFESKTGELGILAKLSEISNKLSGYVQKDKKNAEQKYTFVSEAQYLATVRPLLNEQKVLMVPVDISDVYQRVKQRPAEKNAELLTDSMVIEHATVSVAFIDAEDGSVLVVAVRASGSDQNDKTTYKLMTGAMKYAIGKTFNLATGDDPEDDRFSEKVDDEDAAPARPPKNDIYEPRRKTTKEEPATDREEEDPAPRKPATKAGKKAAPVEKEEEPEETPAAPKKAGKKVATPFNGQMFEDISLDEVYTEMAAATSPDDIVKIVSSYAVKLPITKRGTFRSMLKTQVESLTDALS